MVAISADLGKLRAAGDKGWLRAAAFIAYGQRAWSEAKIESIDAVGEFSFSLSPDLVKQVGAELRRALVLIALTEIEKGFVPFLNELYRISLLATLHGRAAPADIKDRMRAIEAERSITAKMRLIEEQFGLKAGNLGEYARGWSHARNCLHHAKGIVRDTDCTENGKLVVSWMEKDTKIGTTNPREKAFKIGEVIDLSQEEILRVCFTTHLGILGYVAAVKRFAESKISPQTGSSSP